MRHEHDCDKCHPLGEFKEFDLYFCEQAPGFGHTVIARYGKEGDYFSGLASSDLHESLREAKRRAIAGGLLPTT